MMLSILVVTPRASADSTPPSKVERVRSVVELFRTQEAASAARSLAGLAGAVDWLAESDGVDIARSLTAAGSGEVDPDLAAAGDNDVPYDYFDPDAPAAGGVDLDSLVPVNRRYLLEPELDQIMTCPVPNARFWNDWGQPRSGGRTHTGTDLVAPHDSPIYAMADAVVSRVDRVDEHRAGTEQDLGGLTVTYHTVLDDKVFNAHLSSIPDHITPGARIKKGDVIGYVGMSGNARYSVAHLHLQIHPGGGAPHNPFPVLDLLCG
jgi:peptidoglycan LD-endopeptidase LytH